MARLRDPEHGCPWDVKQDFATIAPYTIEEAYEVADAIDRRDYDGLRDELGDLLLQVVFHARMAEEAGHFDVRRRRRGDLRKMLRRHPHVFADAQVDCKKWRTPRSRRAAWEEHKRRERAARRCRRSALAGISRGMPEWQRAFKLQKRASSVGFDWTDPRSGARQAARGNRRGARRIRRRRRSCARSSTRSATCCSSASNLARHGEGGLSARAARTRTRSSSGVSAAWRRSRRRRANRLAGMPLDEQDRYWDRAKAEEKAAAKP